MTRRILLMFMSVLALELPGTMEGSEVAVVSPDGTVRAVLHVDEAAGVRFAIQRGGRPIVESSAMDVRVAEIGSLAAGAAVQRVEEREIDESDDLLWGKSKRIRNHCRAATVRIRSGAGIEWIIELRAYDDGAALRYGLPEQERLGEFVIEAEDTELRLAGDPSVLFMPLAHFTTSHEALYHRKPLSEVPTDKLLAVPLLAVWEDGSAAAITEARLRDFAGMYLEAARDKGRGTGSGERRADSENANTSPGTFLRTRLSPLPDRPHAVVAGSTPHWSPWRVVLLADRAGKLIESNLLLCLNDPHDGDFSWATPGKTTWHWWNGELEHSALSDPDEILTFHKEYIDFCARNNIAYHSVMSMPGHRPWYTQSGPPGYDPRPDTDILTPREELNLPAVLEYAKERGVGIRLWVWWQPLSEKLDEAFATYAEWGVKGLMVDFMDRDDQQMVEWQERCLQAAARHKLHVHFHGSYKPTGEQRTYPNLFNREGVLNLEYLKWSDKCDPPHNVNVAYTRLLAGPPDYHSGGFRSVSRGTFYGRGELPFVLGTRCHQLAMYVVYENPMPMVCDVPRAYEGQAGFDFLVEVPTTWDETRFVAGEAGEYVVVARRSGDDWYLGGMTDWTPRELSLPLDFLGDGKFVATLYLDGSLDEEEPNEVRQETRELTAESSLEASFAPGGGIVAVFKPK